MIAGCDAEHGARGSTRIPNRTPGSRRQRSRGPRARGRTECAFRRSGTRRRRSRRTAQTCQAILWPATETRRLGTAPSGHTTRISVSVDTRRATFASSSSGPTAGDSAVKTRTATTSRTTIPPTNASHASVNLPDSRLVHVEDLFTPEELTTSPPTTRCCCGPAARQNERASRRAGRLLHHRGPPGPSAIRSPPMVGDRRGSRWSRGCCPISGCLSGSGRR